MTTVRLVLLALGVAFIGYLIAQVGPAPLLQSAQTLSWRFLVVLVFPVAGVTVLDTLGWRFAFRRNPTSFLTLYSVRLAGEAFNITTPTASMGGEPVKAYLLQPRVPLEEGLASVIVDKTTVVLAQGGFLLVGLALALGLLSLPSAIVYAMTGFLVVEALAVAGFVVVQLAGIVGGGGRLLARMGLAWADRHANTFHGLDRSVATFYREHRERLGFSILFHFLGWLVGSLEVYLLLHFLGFPVSVVTALVIEAFASAIKFLAFMIPAGLGALEGGNMAVFAAVGLGGGLGLTLTLIRRIRELTWAGAGLVLLACLRTSVTPEVPA